MSQHPRDISRRVVFFCERTLHLEGVFSGVNSVKREAQWLPLAGKNNLIDMLVKGLTNDQQINIK